MNITELSLRRPVTTVMLFVCFAAIGAISARLLPLEYFPSIEFPFVQVQVPYQGSTPEEVERLITKPIEEALSTIGGIEDMRSDSDQNGASIGMISTSALGLNANPPWTVHDSSRCSLRLRATASAAP